MTAGTNSNVGVATTISMIVTKNSDFSYNITSGDTTNAPGWIYLTNSQDWYDALSQGAGKSAIYNEILRQILQI